MRKKKSNQKASSGFTLIELMYSTVLTSIVMVAIGGLVAGYWRTAQSFIAEEQTMQEISMLSKLFMNNARTLPSTTNADTNTSGKVEFLIAGGDNTSLSYDPSFQGIRYDTDTSDGAVGNMLLMESVVSHVFTVITSGNVIRLDVELVESEISKTNSYSMFVTPRNG